jgi:WD40 repeat protein
VIPDDTERFDRLLAELAHAPPERLDEPELARGDRIGRFEILRELGRGGFGIVFEARDTELARHVAVKVLRRPRDGGADPMPALQAEAETVARFQHPAIVTLFDAGVWRGAPYLVLELLRGEPLSARLARGAVPIREALDIAVQIAAALAHAHAAGVIHRDLKPANVFLADEGQAKVLDFGMARFRLSAGGSPEAAGTPAYMAPEQWTGATQDERTDVFALGVTLCEMICGRRPERADAPDPATLAARLRDAGCADDLVALVLRARAFDPAERFASATALRDTLVGARHALDGDTRAEPYRYLEQFGEVDAGWFFGRAVEVARVAQMLAARALVAIVGPSGAGKSSLAHAGVVPRLRASARWIVVTLRPGADPLARLAARLAEHADGTTPPDAAVLAAKPGLAGSALRELAARQGARVLLVVDQLEELFAPGPDAPTRQAFVEALLAIGDDPQGPLRVLVTLREDFLGRAGVSPRLLEQLGAAMLVISPPSVEQLVEIVEGPARRAGYELEPGLARALADGVAGEAAPLPLLQVAASRLWAARDPARRVIGGAAADGDRGVAGLLAAHADEVLEGLAGPGDARTARELFRALVTAEHTRRQLPRATLCAHIAGEPGVAERVLDHLVQGRLLTLLRGDTVELAHEALLSRWPRLRGWLDEDDAFLRFRERLGQAAATWERLGRPAVLLWRRDDLAEAERWRRRRMTTEGPIERAFVDRALARARRSRWIRRGAAALSVLAALAASIASVVAARRWRAEADAARRRLALAAAARVDDPLVAARILGELAQGGEPPGGAAVARRVANEAVPFAVLGPGGNTVYGMAFSPDDRWLATVNADSLRIWPVAGGAPQTVRPTGRRPAQLAFSPDSTILAYAAEDAVRLQPLDGRAAVLLRDCRAAGQLGFSRDGARLVAACADGAVRVWPTSGGPALTVTRYEAPASAAALSPDGTRVCSGATNGALRLSRLDPAAPDLPLAGHDGFVGWCRFDGSGRRVVTASADGTARVFRADGALVAVLRGHTLHLNDATFSPDGDRVLTSSLDGTARIFRADGAGAPLVFQGHDGKPILAAAFTPDGTAVLVTTSDGAGRVFRADGTGGPLLSFRAEPGLAAIAVGHRDPILATAGGDVRLWRLGGAGDPVVLGTHLRAIHATVERADGRRLLVISNDGTASLWQLEPPRRIAVLVARTETLDGAFLSDGRVVIGGGDGTIRIWPAEGGEAASVVAVHGRGEVVLAIAAGDRIASVSEDGTACLTGAGGERLGCFAPDAGTATAGVLSPDGLTAALAIDHGVRIAPTAGGAPVILPHPAVVRALVFTPAGDRLISGADDGVVRVWPTGGGAPLDLAGGAAAVIAVAAGGSWVAAVDAGGDARLWPIAGGPATRLPGGDGPWTEVALRDDGRYLALRGAASARVMPVDAPGEAVELPHPLAVTAIAFSRDGRRIVTGGMDGEARIFRFLWPDLVAYLTADRPGCLDAHERMVYLGESASTAAARAAACAGARGP